MAAKNLKQYRAKEWFSFRQEMLHTAKHQCERCQRATSDGVILQVHHKRYDAGKMPWDYSFEQCEVLCKRCHAVEHGRIKPTSEWELVGEDDLGALDGICDHCGNEIRYVFFIEHPKWNSMAVGKNCCDNLTESSQASEYQRRFERKKRLLESPLWKPLSDRKGVSIIRSGVRLEIWERDHDTVIVVDGVVGKRRYSDQLDAKTKLFELLENGEIADFLKRRKTRKRHR